MSVISLSLRIRNFNIKISIDKHPKGFLPSVQSDFAFERRFQRATREREALQAVFHQNCLF